MTGYSIANTNIHYFRFPYSAFLDTQVRLDIPNVVIWGSVPHIWVDQFGVEPCVSIFEETRKAGRKITAYAARPYNYTLFADALTPLGCCSVKYYQNIIDLLAGQNVHLLGIDLWGALRDLEKKEQYYNCVKNLTGLLDYAQKAGIKLMVGNIPYANSAMMNAIEDVKLLVQDVQMTNLSVALEFGQMASMGETVADWMDAFQEKIEIIYLSDGRAQGFGYPLGQGVLPIEKTLAELTERGYRGTVTLKMDRARTEQDPFKADSMNVNYLSRKRLW